jgi:pimeloyl-ACP methyl ester carboxylesterase
VALVNVNDVHLYYERTGIGDPLVLVHGSWGDHTNWDAFVPLISEQFDIISYDRRGHSDSERPDTQGSADEDADDLAALIETLDVAPVRIVANSYGGIVTLRLAGRRPELIRSICLHEPPGFPLIADDPENAPLLEQSGKSIAAVVSKLAAGEYEKGAMQFVDEVAFGPNVWNNELPAETKAMFIRNAPTFLDECRDPHQLEVDLDSISSFDRPALLTNGDQSLPLFPKVVDQLARVLPNVERKTLLGAGHVPQLTHPQLLADTVAGFAHGHS